MLVFSTMSSRMSYRSSRQTFFRWCVGQLSFLTYKLKLLTSSRVPRQKLHGQSCSLLPVVLKQRRKPRPKLSLVSTSSSSLGSTYSNFETYQQTP